jgi:hypothetical protein
MRSEDGEDSVMDKAMLRKFYDALHNRDNETFTSLLGQYPELLDEVYLGHSILHAVAAENNVPMIEFLLGLGMDVDGPDLDSDGPLIVAICKGAVDAVHYLFKHGADPNRGRTLIAAINNEEHGLEFVRLLVEHGADVNRCFHLGDDDGPLFNALSWAGDDDSPIANYLRSKGARTPEELGVTAQAAVSDPVVAHFAGRFGPVRPQSLGEIVPDDVPIALHVVSPTVARPHVVLFTKGMSAHPMTVPVGEEDYRFAELFIELPGDWPMGDHLFHDPDSSWPVDWLRRLAKYPHYNQTWLGGPVAIVSNGDPPEPLSPGSPLTALLLLADGDFRRPDGSIVQTYRLFPLFSEERDLEQALGADELLRRFDRAGIGFVVDSNRQNVAMLTS